MANYPRWLRLAKQFDAENLKDIPRPSKIISNNGIALVYRALDGIYKRSIPFLIENEIFCLLNIRQFSKIVPMAVRYDKYTIWMEDLGESEPVSDKDKFMESRYAIINALQKSAIRHGDLTTANIIVKDNWAYVVDWAESRMARDIRADKRPEGDTYWLDKTWTQLLGEMDEREAD